MKLTNQQLKQIIREELQNVLGEAEFKYKSIPSDKYSGGIRLIGPGQKFKDLPGSGGGQTSDLERALYRKGFKGYHDLISKANAGDEAAMDILRGLGVE